VPAVPGSGGASEEARSVLGAFGTDPGVSLRVSAVAQIGQERGDFAAWSDEEAALTGGSNDQRRRRADGRAGGGQRQQEPDQAMGLGLPRATPSPTIIVHRCNGSRYIGYRTSVNRTWWKPVLAFLLIAGLVVVLAFAKAPLAGAAGGCGGG
jgi:hypothetical protein